MKEEVVTTPLYEKKSLTKDVEEGTDKLADVTFMEKKASTKNFDKGIDELADMKQGVVTILRKGLDQFEGKYSGSKGCFKLDSGFLKTTFSKSHSGFYKELFKKNIEDQDIELHKFFILPFDK